MRALIEAAHTEAWAVLNTYRDILDSLASALLEKETLDRRDLEVIFAEVEKRPRITTFDEFGPRLPSDRPPIKTPGELAIERGEPWPPPENQPEGRHGEPIPVGAAPAYPGGQSGYNTGPGYPAGGQPVNSTAGPGPSQIPPNWTGGVLPGPLGPMPGWQPGPDPGAGGQGGYSGPTAPGTHRVRTRRWPDTTAATAPGRASTGQTGPARPMAAATARDGPVTSPATTMDRAARHRRRVSRTGRTRRIPGLHRGTTGRDGSVGDD